MSAAADRVGPIAVQTPSLRSANDARQGQERLERLLDADRTGARPAAAVRGRERLVEVELHHVGAHVARLGDAEQRVEVGAVEVEQGAVLVQHLRDLADLGLEHAERVGIGDHQRRDVIAHQAPDLGRLQASALVGLCDHHLKPASAELAGLVPCAVSGMSTLWRGPAALAMVGADHQQAGQLALRPGRGMQRDRVHPADFGQRRPSRPSTPTRPAPGARESADAGRRSPAMPRISSLTGGLYFIVHEPSG